MLDFRMVSITFFFAPPTPPQIEVFKCACILVRGCDECCRLSVDGICVQEHDLYSVGLIICNLQRMIELNMPMDSDGKVKFHCTLFALVRSSLKIDCRGEQLSIVL